MCGVLIEQNTPPPNQKAIGQGLVDPQGDKSGGNRKP